MGKILVVLLLALSLSGCGGTTGTYLKYDPKHEKADKHGFVPVYRIHLNKGGMLEATPDGVMKLDSRERSLYDKIVAPLIKGAADKASVAPTV